MSMTHRFLSKFANRLCNYYRRVKCLLLENKMINNLVKYCQNCNRAFRNGEHWFSCVDCMNYNLCEICQTRTALQSSQHSHQFVCKYSIDYGLENICTKIDTASRILSSIEFNSNRRCLGIRSNSSNDYSWLTFETIGNRIKNFSFGLLNLIKPREFLGICSANRPEWLITDLACILQGIISVPIYCQLTNHDLTYIINHTKISAIVCDEIMLPKLIQIKSQCSTLRHLISMDSIPQENNNNLFIHDMQTIENIGSSSSTTTTNKDYVINKPDDYVTIVYTSGSSGFPKGAILTENVFRSTFPIRNSSSFKEAVKFCYRPLAWITDRKATIAAFLDGGCTGFATGDMSQLMDELTLVSPTSFSAPPTFWNKIYSEYRLALSLTADSTNERILLEQFSKLIPRSCRVISIGGAMVHRNVLQFIRECFQHCQIVEAYGTTECGRITFNYQFLRTMLDFRLESVIEMGYTLDDKPYPRGELLVKTSQMFAGYINNPEETQAALTDDGYFRTGDIVEQRSIDHTKPDLHIIDRKKNFFKLAQGQYVSPESLENIYLQSLYIEQIFVYGDYFDDRVKAVIVPNKQYTRTMDMDEDLLVKEIIDDLQMIAKNESLHNYEIPLKIIIESERFTCENGLLTLSMKLCRHKLLTKYARSIEDQLKTIIEHHQLSADSLSNLRLSHMIRQNLGITIPVQMLFDSNLTFKRLVDLIRNPSSPISDCTQFINDSQIEFDIPMGKTKELHSSPSMIFITGVTGFVGAFLLAELLKKFPSTCKLMCLVRGELDRIRKTMEFYQLWKDEFDERIIGLQGDLTKEQFGFDKEFYCDLTKKIDLIYHCGAIVNFTFPYSKLYDTNVNGTREIIRFATYSSTFIPIHYTSTMSAVDLHHLKTGYSQSKWVAERLMLKASQLGLPVIIYRLGSMGPNTETGACNPNDINTLLVTTIIETGVYPSMLVDSKMQILPIDIAVQRILSFYNNQFEQYGQIYSIVNNHDVIPLQFIFDRIRQLDISLECISNDAWKTDYFDLFSSYFSKRKLQQNDNRYENNVYIDKWLLFIQKQSKNC